MLAVERIQALAETDEVARHERRALMQQLIERMLPVGARLAPDDRRRGIVHARTGLRHVLAVALHRQLLQVGRKALQILVVGQHGLRLRLQEVGVPDCQQSHQYRQVLTERCAQEVFVHRVKPFQHGAKLRRPDGEHQRQANRRVHRIAPADPVPEAEHVGWGDAELRDPLGVGRYGHEVPGHSALVAKLRHTPGTRCFGVGQCLQRGKGLRADDEQRFGSIQTACRLDDVGGVDVRDELATQIALAVVLERFVPHHRPEVGAADADIDDVPDAFAGVPQPDAGAHRVGECGHAIENRLHLGHDVDAIDDEARAGWSAQRRVQGRALLGRVDRIAAEHRVDSRAQAAAVGESEQQPERLVVDAVLGVV